MKNNLFVIFWTFSNGKRAKEDFVSVMFYLYIVLRKAYVFKRLKYFLVGLGPHRILT